MENFGQTFIVPDFWQAEAISSLRNGYDVVLDAPTGAGKTFVFEEFYKSFEGRVVYTVPTRALANDKYEQWRSSGLRVGISTGDRLENEKADLIVATLETQREHILSGRSPDMFVVDEYQLLGDSQRGVAYETAIAMLPKSTKLLLMSGSVENSAEVVEWLSKLGRKSRLIRQTVRAVPLEEISAIALSETSAKSVRSFWGNIVQRAIEADMAPILIFAPRRKDAEAIAANLSAELPCKDFIKLPHRIEMSAGRHLANMLRRGIACHHSGLTAFQRAGIIERYARDGDLRVVVATTGLGAGVNFSMRSVIIADREYESFDGTKMLRPDELLQMYGRAGRRGRDTIGYAITLPARPSLSQARQCVLTRADFLDIPSIIRLMSDDSLDTKGRIRKAEEFCEKLFCNQPPKIEFESVIRSKKYFGKNTKNETSDIRRTEIKNSQGLWERRRPKVIAKISEVLFFNGEKWIEFTKSANAVASLKRGNPCKLSSKTFGLYVDVASLGQDGYWKLSGTFGKDVRKLKKGIVAGNPFAKKQIGIKNLRRNLAKYIDVVFAGAKLVEILESDNFVRAKVNITEARIETYLDCFGSYLYNPLERKVDVSGEWDFEALAGFGESAVKPSDSPAKLMLRLGLIDSSLKPTERGKIFSYFSKGEGLAVAAAIEDLTYSPKDIVFDLANLRAGRRFSMSERSSGASSRMGDVCRAATLNATIKGYLKGGVPQEYGDGAAEVMREICAKVPVSALETETLRRGDIERAKLEWQSLLRHTAAAPKLDNPRWQELQLECERLANFQ